MAKDIPVTQSNAYILSLIKVVVYEEFLVLLIPKNTYSDCKALLETVLDKSLFLGEYDSIYLVEGPRSYDVVQGIVSEEIRSIQYHESVLFKKSNICLRCSLFGELGYLLFIKSDLREIINFFSMYEQHLLENRDVAVLSAEANCNVWNKTIFRNECPIELGFSYALDFEDDEFVFHKEINERRKNNQQRRVAFILNDVSNIPDTVDIIGCQLFSKSRDRTVGCISRAYFSKKVNKVIGYALVDIDNSYLGTNLVGVGDVSIKITKTPFFVTNSHNLEKA